MAWYGAPETSAEIENARLHKAKQEEQRRQADEREAARDPYRARCKIEPFQHPRGR